MELSKDKIPNVSAKFSIKPDRSQSSLITTLLLSGFSLGVGFLFLWNEKNYSWVPIIISLVLVFLVFISWWHSQKIIDMAGSSPTRFCDSEGNELTTDTRALESNNAVRNMGILLQAISDRQPLPIPDGLIDEKGKPVPNSKVDAEKKVIEINGNLAEKTQKFADEILSPSPEVEQTFKDLPEEAFNGILETNQVNFNEMP